MPEEVLDSTGNQDVDGSPASGNADGGGNDNEPFLVVNDRTTFKSREDAVKSYDEAGKRIEALSQWEKEIREDFPNASPRQVRQWLREYANKLQQEQEAKHTATAEPSKSDGKTASDEQLNPEEQKALDWLKKHAPKLGFVPKEELQSLKDELKKMQDSMQGLQQGNNESFERYRTSLIQQGQTQLTGLLTDAGIDTTKNPDLRMQIEEMIKASVNADDELLARFFNGESSQVIAEVFGRIKSLMGITAQKASVSYAANKNQVINRTPRRLPNEGTASRSKPNGKAEKESAADLHKRAYAAAQKHWGGAEAE